MSHTKMWDDAEFHDWIACHAHRELRMELEEIDDLLRGVDLSTEQISREFLADHFPALTWPAVHVDMFYT